MATSRRRSIFGHIPKGYLNIRQNAASCRRTHALGAWHGTVRSS